MNINIIFYAAEYGLGEDVVLIEQGTLGGGTATNATGLLGVLKLNLQETRIAMTSTKLYRFVSILFRHKLGYYYKELEVFNKLYLYNYILYRYEKKHS